MMENFPKLVTDFKPQIQEAESIKQEKYQKKKKQPKNPFLGISYSNCRKSKKRKFLKRANGGQRETLYPWRSKDKAIAEFSFL